MSFRVHVKADFSRMKKFPDIIAPIVRDALRQGAAWIAADAARLAPKGATGELKRSIKIRERGFLDVHVVADTEYAACVEYGTRAHIIRARRAQALRWKEKGSGKVRFAKWVRHPGTFPQPFLRPAYAKNKALITQLLKDMLIQYVRKGVYFRSPKGRKAHWVRQFAIRGSVFP